MMMIVRAAPNAAGTERKNAENTHQPFCEARFGQDGMMLLVVVNHEEAEHQQSGENAANTADDGMKMPKGAAERGQQQKSRRQYAPPAPRGVVFGERLGGEDELVARSRRRRRQFHGDRLLLR
jgi:hypothetical protein